MCCQCWREEGAHTTLPSNYDEFARLYAEVYEANSVGGKLHIILDDFNIEDEQVAFCEEVPGKTEAETACLVELRRMTQAERCASLGLLDGCWKRGGEEG
mgnify:CR=1 FL=1